MTRILRMNDQTIDQIKALLAVLRKSLHADYPEAATVVMHIEDLVESLSNPE